MKIRNNVNLLDIIPLIIMTLLSVTIFFGLKIGNVSVAGLGVFFGLIYFFFHKYKTKTSQKESGLDLRSIKNNLGQISIWFLILLPILLDIIAISLSKRILPEYISHVISRIEGTLSLNKLIILIPQLLILALGEEIAWRALFQKLSVKYFTFIPGLLMTSALFALGHLSSGSFAVVAYDLFFVFVNSIVYGIIFYKTNNAYISTISHFLSNLFSLFLIVL